MGKFGGFYKGEKKKAKKDNKKHTGGWDITGIPLDQQQLSYALP